MKHGEQILKSCFNGITIMNLTSGASWTLIYSNYILKSLETCYGSIDFDVYSDHKYPCNIQMFMAKSNLVP